MNVKGLSISSFLTAAAAVAMLPSPSSSVDAYAFAPPVTAPKMTSTSTATATAAFNSVTTATSTSRLDMAAESEVSFDDKLDGSDVRIGIIRTRWNEPDVKSLVEGTRKALKECNVKESNIFETTVPGSFELPLAARFLALSGTVDAIVTAGVLIKGETLHFEYISDSVVSGLMSVQLQTSVPVVYGVLNCMNDEQVKARSTGNNNHGYDWGKTAVEMALLRNEALNMKGPAGGSSGSKSKLMDLGFGKVTPVGTGGDGGEKETSKPGYF
eukprot:CAMPEP_0113486500 /NCGR_PEP_ID=MMETSP0014_2-20120614/25028_1 /TAXON_ID=2857 /ORGANISM="Nitzschia sp." /LENGTH=269 /DNA_ID=CAMNT_0000380173 /DNA_START=153 /DNA_END=962 /DNA_ORIENTATION=+ /assembly_acc=CAM_ASM_000159